jgi:hypothetical protein
MPDNKRFLKCPECGGRIFQSDAKCMGCGADLEQHRRQAEAEWAATEEDWIGEAARQKTVERETTQDWEKEARIESEMMAKEPAALARSSADYLTWAGGGALVLGILGFIGSLESQNYVLGVSLLLGGIGWLVIFLAASRLLLCVAQLTENVASMNRRQAHSPPIEPKQDDAQEES